MILGMKYSYQKEALRTAREALGYTQENAAYEIGVSRATWIKWESGETCPDAVQVALICDLFKIEPAKLFN
jgi:DNA-binding XRE family transcriptional regulator